MKLQEFNIKKLKEFEKLVDYLDAAFSENRNAAFLAGKSFLSSEKAIKGSYLSYFSLSWGQVIKQKASLSFRLFFKSK
jgi:hypothetical protein